MIAKEWLIEYRQMFGSLQLDILNEDLLLGAIRSIEE